jgi:hypothetical protein
VSNQQITGCQACLADLGYYQASLAIPRRSRPELASIARLNPPTATRMSPPRQHHGLLSLIPAISSAASLTVDHRPDALPSQPARSTRFVSQSRIATEGLKPPSPQRLAGRRERNLGVLDVSTCHAIDSPSPCRPGRQPCSRGTRHRNESSRDIARPAPVRAIDGAGNPVINRLVWLAEPFSHDRHVRSERD